MTSRAGALALAVFIVTSSALVAVLAKLALRTVDPLTFVGLQIGLGGVVLCLYTFVFRRERVPRMGRFAWASILAIGIGNFTIVRVLLVFSLDLLPAVTHAFLFNFVGLVTMVLSAVLLRERPTLLQILGGIGAIVGLRVFFGDIPEASERAGVVYCGFAVLTLALTNIIARRLPARHPEISTTVVSTLAFLIGGIPVTLTALARGGVAELAPREALIVVACGVVTIAFGMTAWNFILRTLRSYEASVLAGLTVPTAALFAIPILGATLSLREVLGVVIVLVSLTLTQMRRER